MRPVPLVRAAGASRSGTTLLLAAAFLAAAAFPSAPACAQDAPALQASHLSFLEARNLGGAFMSGRIVEIAVDPEDRATWYIAAASGGVWKTENAGVTWAPIFDRYGSYSIGTVTVDPNDRFTVWVGTGENNSQRSVGYGDGVYKSVDGGATFTRVGLPESQHIARIVVDPRDSDRVLVASQGPLWSSGGERGVYRTKDGGATWERVLHVDEHTGISDLFMDPRDPDVLYAASYQRRRHVWTLINGGPGSGIWKSTDGGDSWREVNRGLPSGDRGRIGLAQAHSRPDWLYAIVELPGGEGGTYRSSNGGESWERRSGYVAGSPQYYNEIYVDLHDPELVYSLDTYMMVSEDGGATFRRLGEADKHVDNHALWIDPLDRDHLLVGSDGGLYETWDRGRTYRFFGNLPLAQYYKVAVGQDGPFYHVYGGTQDNATHGVPNRTTNTHGIRPGDWYTTVFGDGFGPAVDPTNPDIVYSQWQHGGLVRYDRLSGEAVDIKPRESADGPPLKWNWDAPLLISPHDPARLYFGAQVLFRSDDRGDSWRPVSGDLTRKLDRNALEVMGRVWSVDAVAKNASTSIYGNLTALTESPLVEGLLYTGSDDGVVSVSEDGGTTWRALERIPGVPEMTYVNDLEASLHDPNTVYAAFNNHKMGDFRPYLLVSRDRGRSWQSMAGDLPERGSVYTVVQDHVDPDLFFAGTEFGVHVTRDGGATWHKLGGGIPTVAIRDLAIQRRENDLVAGSFGRGFWIVEDYAALRDIDGAVLEADAHVFPVRRALAFQQVTPLGVPGKAFQGADFHTDANPSFGASFTYWLKDELRTARAERQGRERELQRAGEDTPYPAWDELKAEDREEAPRVVLTVRDPDGGVVRRITGPTGRGMHRVTWDLRYPGFTPITADTRSDGSGPMAVPGQYTVEVAAWDDGSFRALTGAVPFQVEAVGVHTLPVPERAATLAFLQDAGELQRVVMGTVRSVAEAREHLEAARNALERDVKGTEELQSEARALELRLMDLNEVLSGDPTLPRRQEAAMPGVVSRLGSVVGNVLGSTYGPTQTHRDQLEIARAAFAGVELDLRTFLESELPGFMERLEALGIRWTPGMGMPRR
ncbi:MAG: hypothetical protein RQ751_03935 [Longimicrobiales bacterium]|nr:hypothetical protein [Longimicrobiales bacterium]